MFFAVGGWAGGSFDTTGLGWVILGDSLYGEGSDCLLFTATWDGVCNWKRFTRVVSDMERIHFPASCIKYILHISGLSRGLCTYVAESMVDRLPN